MGTPDFRRWPPEAGGKAMGRGSAAYIDDFPKSWTEENTGLTKFLECVHVWHACVHLCGGQRVIWGVGH